MLEWITSRKVTHVILLVGALCIFFASFKISPEKSSIIPELLPNPHYPVVAMGGVLLLAALVFELLDSHHPRLKQISGEWKYSVIDNDADQTYRHSGVAEIYQDGHHIRIDGFRKIMSWSDSDGEKERKVNIHWNTSWGWLDDEGVLRYDYEMAIPGRGARIMGYVRIQASRKERTPIVMSGTYYMLPPFSKDVANAQWGTITWERVTITKQSWFSFKKKKT